MHRELNCVEVSVSSQCARGVLLGNIFVSLAKLLIESNGHEREINSIPQRAEEVSVSPGGALKFI
jgi:hypothetical protein